MVVLILLLVTVNTEFFKRLKQISAQHIFSGGFVQMLNECVLHGFTKLDIFDGNLFIPTPLYNTRPVNSGHIIHPHLARFFSLTNDLIKNLSHLFARNDRSHQTTNECRVQSSITFNILSLRPVTSASLIKSML